MSRHYGIISIVTIMVIICLCFMFCYLTITMLDNVREHEGTINTHYGFIYDVDYSSGSFTAPSATYISWRDGTVTILYGDDNAIMQDTYATITYHGERKYKYFEGIKYGEQI